MKLHSEWKMILQRAWSVRLIALAAVLSAVPVFLALVNADLLGIPPVAFAAMSALAGGGAFAARFIAQPGAGLEK